LSRKRRQIKRGLLNLWNLRIIWESMDFSMSFLVYMDFMKKISKEKPDYAGCLLTLK